MPFVKDGGNPIAAPAAVPASPAAPTGKITATPIVSPIAPPPAKKASSFVKAGKPLAEDPPVWAKSIADMPAKKVSVPIDTLMRSPRTRELLKGRNPAKFAEAMQAHDEAESIKASAQQSAMTAGKYGPWFGDDPQQLGEKGKKYSELRAKAEKLFNELMPDGGYGQRWISNAEAEKSGLLPTHEKTGYMFSSNVNKGRRINRDPNAGAWYDFDPETAEWKLAKERRSAEQQSIKHDVSTSNIIEGYNQANASTAGLLMRGAEMLGLADSGSADAANRLTNARGEVSDANDPSTLGRAVRSSVRSVVQAAQGAAVGYLTGTGPAATIGLFAGTAGNEAYTEALDAGKTPEEAKRFAVNATAIEGGITAAMQMIPGMAGMEKQFTAKAIRETAKSFGKTFVKDMGAEQVEELMVGAADNFNRIKEGVNPNDWGPLFKDTILATALTMGAMKTPGGIAAGVRTAQGTTDDPLVTGVRGPNAGLLAWVEANPARAKVLYDAFAQGKPITRGMMRDAGLAIGDQEQRNQFGRVVSLVMQRRLAGGLPAAPAEGGIGLQPAGSAADRPGGDPLGAAVYDYGQRFGAERTQEADLQGDTYDVGAEGVAATPQQQEQLGPYVPDIGLQRTPEELGRGTGAASHLTIGDRVEETSTPDGVTHRGTVVGINGDWATVQPKFGSPYQVLARKLTVTPKNAKQAEPEAPSPVSEQAQTLPDEPLPLVPSSRNRQAAADVEQLLGGRPEPDFTVTEEDAQRATEARTAEQNAKAGIGYSSVPSKSVLAKGGTVTFTDGTTRNYAAGEATVVPEMVENGEVVRPAMILFKGNIEHNLDDVARIDHDGKGGKSTPAWTKFLPGESNAAQAQVSSADQTATPAATPEPTVAGLVDRPDIGPKLATGVAEAVGPVAGKNAKQQARIIAALKRLIPRVQITELPDGTGIELVLPRNGRRLRIVRVADIKHPTGKKVNGAFTMVYDDADVANFGEGLIVLHDGNFNETTVAHEMLHAAFALGMIDKNSPEYKKLARKYGNIGDTEAEVEEAIVTAWEQWYRGNPVWRKVLEIFGKILDVMKLSRINTETQVFTRISRGEVFGRSGAAMDPQQWAASLMNSAAFSVDTAGAQTGEEAAEARQAWHQLGTQSPWFKEWFGNSVVVNEDGSPKEMYHGGNSSIDTVDIEMGEWGFHVGTMEQAEERALQKSPQVLDVLTKRVFNLGANVMPLYVRLENPVRLKDAGQWTKGEILTQLVENGTLTLDEAKSTSDNTSFDSEVAKQNVIALLRSKGIDGAVYLNRYEGVGTITNDVVYLSDEKYREAHPDAQDSYIIFSPTQAKSSRGNRGTFDNANPGLVFSAEQDPTPIWIDNVLESLKSWQPKGTPAQLMAHLGKTKGANDEAKWIGLDEFLKDKPSVTRVDVEKFVEANRVQLSEKVLDGDTQYEDYQLPGGENYREMLLALPSTMRGDAPTRTQYVLINPDGDIVSAGDETAANRWRGMPAAYRFDQPDGYRIDTRQIVDQAALNKLSKKSGDYFAPHFHGTPNILAHVRFNERTVDDPNGPVTVIVREKGMARRGKAGTSTKKFATVDEANAFRALKEKSGYDVEVQHQKQRVLFLEEVQSDWHQTGRKGGYDDTKKSLESDDIEYLGKSLAASGYKFQLVLAEKYDTGRPGSLNVFGNTEEEARVNALARINENRQKGVPDAPFKQSWPMLAVKRMIRWAAEHGFDKLAWTTGEQQAERYSLANQVKDITLLMHPEDEGAFGDIVIYGFDNQPLLDQRIGIDNGELERTIGKEAAKKLLDSKPDSQGYKRLRGDGLKVGGEGMKGFYDRMLPTEIGKFAKKFGGKVGSIQIEAKEGLYRPGYEYMADLDSEGVSIYGRANSYDDWEFADHILGDPGKMDETAVLRDWKKANGPTPTEVHSLDITPAMRESAMNGMLMFSVDPEARTTGRPWPASIKQAAVAVSMSLGRWRKASAASTKMQEEFLRELKNNESSATLSQYEPSELADLVSSGSMDVFQLDDHRIYFGLKKGAPWYRGMIPGITGNEVELVSVISNETDAKGMAAPAVLTRAIELGATVLDCFSVISDRFQDGFLPTLYGKFGFEKIGSIPFDPTYYNAEQLTQLESLWEKGGWKRGTPRPEVVVMRWRGNDGQRFDATSRYLREGTAGLRGRSNPDADGRDVRQAHGSGSATASPQPGAAGGDRGNQGANGSSLASGAYRVVQGLLGLNDTELGSLGLNKRTQERVANAIKDPFPPAPAAAVSTSFIDRTENLTYEEAFAEGVIDPDKRSPANKTTKTVFADEAAKLLEKRYEELGQPRTPVGSETSADIVRMAKFIFDEARSAIQHSRAKTALGWYEAKVKRAMQLIGLIEPAVGVEPEDTLMFTLALAITSDGEEVDSNFATAIKAYRQWKASRGPDGRGGLMNIIGHRAGVEINLKAISKLYDEFGWKALYDFMSTKRTVKELEDLGFKVSGERKATQVYGAMVLGPKIGSFWNNLNGNFDTITMDLWWTRTIGRARGILLTPRWDLVQGTYDRSFSKLMTKAECERVSAIIKMPVDHARLQSDLKYAASIATAMAAKNESTFTGTNYRPITKKLVKQLTKPSKYGEVSVDATDSVSMLTDKSMKAIYEDMIADLADKSSRLSKAGATQRQVLRSVLEAQATRLAASSQSFKDAKSMDGNMSGEYEKPDGAPDRHVHRMIARLAMRMFDAWNRSLNPGSPTIEPADFQALLWFWEKRLWAKMGVRAKGDIESAYDTAAGKLVREELLESDPAKAALIGENGVVLKPRELFSGKTKGGVLGRKRTGNKSAVEERARDGDAINGLIKELAKRKAIVSPEILEDAERLSEIVESLRRPKAERSSMDISLTAATNAQPGLRLLTEAAAAGDASAYDLLQKIATDFLRATLGKMASVNFVGSIQKATGQYFGNVHPSLSLRITFNEKDRVDVVARLKAFAEAHSQSGVYVRGESPDPVGTDDYGDGSYVTPVYKFSGKSMTVPQLQSLVDQVNEQLKDDSGVLALPGVTVTKDGVEAFFVGDIRDEQAVERWTQAVESLSAIMGEGPGAIRRETARLWPYGDARHEIGWQQAVGRGLSAEEQVAVAKIIESNTKKIRDFLVKRNGSALSTDMAAAVGRSSGPMMYSAESADDVYERPKGGKLGTIARWMFKAAGDLPGAAFAAKEKMHGYLNSHERQMRFVLADLRKAVKQVYGEVPKLGSRDWNVVDAVLRGGDPRMLPLPMRDPVVRMRKHVDHLSKAIIESGAASEKLAATIDENMGVYLTRTYRVFSDPDWYKKVPEEIRNRFRSWLSAQYPDLTDKQLDQQIGELLRHGTAADTPATILSRGKLGAKLMDVLKQRKNLPIELRELWGEETNPLVNYAASISKMTRVVAAQQFLNEVKDAGLGKWLFTSDDPNIDPQAVVPIAADGSSPMSPLNGLRTYPEVLKAFEDEYKQPQQHPFWRWYFTMNLLAKGGKTVGSPRTQVRNFLSNIGMVFTLGHWRIWKIGEAVRAAAPGITAFGSAAARAGADIQAWRDLHVRLTKLGVIGEDVGVGELKQLLSEAAIENSKFLNNIAVRWAKSLAAGAAQVYQGSDNFWKAYAFFNERASYAKAFPEFTPEQLDRIAADNVRNTMPTYSKISKAIQALRHVPMGNFFSWPAEIVRTSTNATLLALQEIRDPRTRLIGARRLVGILGATTSGSWAVQMLAMLLGVTPDDDEDKRDSLPPWSKNSLVLWLENGNYVDVSYGDPYAYMRKPIMTILKGGDLRTAVAEAARELADPFVTEQLLGERIADVTLRGGMTADKRQVYNPEDEAGEQTAAIFKHIVEPMIPVGIASAWDAAFGDEETITEDGRVIDPQTEFIWSLFGARVSKVDVPRALFFKAGDFDAALGSSDAIFYRTATERTPKSSAELAEAYRRADGARRRNFDKMHDSIHKAMRTGVPEAEVLDILKSRGISKELSEQLVSGKYEPYMPSPATMARIEAAPDGQRRKADVLSLYVAHSPNPQDAQASLEAEQNKRVQRARQDLRYLNDPSKARQRALRRPGESAEAYAARQSGYGETRQRALKTLEDMGPRVGGR